MLNKLRKIVQALETSQIPFSYYMLTFAFAVTLRNFLETFFTGEILSYTLLEDLSHYYLSYVCLAMAFIILFYFATREKIEKISRVILPSFLILILAPFLDLSFLSWKTFNIGYMFPDRHENLLLRFFTFFGPLERAGVTLGMRIEIALVIVGSFIYFSIKGKDIRRSLVFAILTYVVIFIYCAVPFAVETFLNTIGLKCSFSPSLMINFYLFLIFIIGLWLFYLYNRKYCIEIFKDIRPFRLLHFELMFVLGVVLSEIFYRQPMRFTQDTLFYWMHTMIAIMFAWLFSVMTNNTVDRDIDTISNRTRPTVSGAIPIGHYRQLSRICFICAVIYSAAVNFRSLFFILLFIGNYFLYSMPPLRLKRIPFFSKLLISLNSFALVILGCFFHSGNFIIPLSVVIFFMVGFTAAINFIDIKDYEGDKKAGIKTLPTVFGLKKGKMIIGLFFFASYALAPFAFGIKALVVPFAAIGLLQFILLTREQYNERGVFAVYLLSIVLLMVYLKMTFAG